MKTEALETLQPTTRTWARRVTKRWNLEEHHEKLLLLAGQAFDRCQQARAMLDADGLTVETANGLKTHPAVAIERDSRLAYARILRELQLDAGAPDAPRKPMY